jgi:hypothetical protein
MEEKRLTCAAYEPETRQAEQSRRQGKPCAYKQGTRSRAGRLEPETSGADKASPVSIEARDAEPERLCP